MPRRDAFDRLDASATRHLGRSVVFRGEPIRAIVMVGVEVRFDTGGEDISFTRSTVSGLVDTVDLRRELNPKIGEIIEINGKPRKIVQLISATDYSQVFVLE